MSNPSYNFHYNNCQSNNFNDRDNSYNRNTFHQSNNSPYIHNIYNNDYKNLDYPGFQKANYIQGSQNQTNINNPIINDCMIKYNYGFEKDLCGIKNYGNNCYFNSGLQILVSCERFLEELKKYNTCYGGPLTKLLREAIYILQNEKKYEPYAFLTYFTKKNTEFFGVQSCSQNFIRTLLKNLNDELNTTNNNLIVAAEYYRPPIDTEEGLKYYNFIKSNNIYPESSLLSIFSGITKSHSLKNCDFCKGYINNISFSYFIDQNIYLDEINSQSKWRFSDVLRKNFEKTNITMNCPYCHQEINLSEETKIIKLPEILIFTLERYQGENNDAEIEPDDSIEMKNYVDNCLINTRTSYELFAINIRFGKTKNSGHEICQVKRKGKWLEFNDEFGYAKVKDYNRNSYGLFYKRK